MERAIEKNNKGVAFFLKKNFEKAKLYYEEALESDEENATALNNMGLLYHQQKEYTKAISYFRSALEVRKSDTYFLNLANALAHSSKNKEAEDNYKKCLEVNPNNLNAKISLAKFYQFNGRPEMSIGIWENIANTTNNFEYKIEFAKNYMEIGQYKKALFVLSYVQKLDAEQSKVNYYIGICEYNLKNYGFAESAFNSCLALEPDNYNVRHFLAVNYLGKGEYNKALKELDFIIKLNPKALKVKLDKAIVLLNLNRYNESLTLFDEVLQFDSEHKKALHYKNIVMKFLKSG